MAVIGAWGRGPSGQPALGPGVLAGGQVVVVNQEGMPTRYVMAYEYPPGSGKNFTFQFTDRAQIDATFGKDWPQRLPFVYHSGGWLDKQVNGGNAAEVVGLEGGWTNYVNNAITQGLQESGVTDPTILGKMMKDPEIQNVMLNAFVGDWNEVEILAAQRNTNFYKNVLYPGIANFYGQTSEPERAYQNYTQNVEGALTSLGYARDADGTFKSTIGSMLNQKITDSTFVAAAPTFLRATQSQDYFNTLSQWVQQDLGKTLTFGDWFGLLAGESEPDIAQTAERATLAYLADQGGVQVDPTGIMRLAADTDMSDAQAKAAFAEFDSALTALGARGIQKYGLSRDDLFSLKTGIKALSGRSLEDIRVKSLQAMREEGVLDDQKIDLYIGYDPNRGTPNRPGMSVLAPSRE